jgi:hypothetical protein
LVKSEDSKVLVGYLDSTMLEVSGFSWKAARTRCLFSSVLTDLDQPDLGASWTLPVSSNFRTRSKIAFRVEELRSKRCWNWRALSAAFW